MFSASGASYQSGSITPHVREAGAAGFKGLPNTNKKMPNALAAKSELAACLG